MAIKHAHNATGTNSGGGEVHKDEWNDDHVNTALGAKAYGTGISIPSGSYTAAGFGSEYWDNGGFHSNVTNNSRMVVPSGGDGLYAVVFATSWDNNTSGVVRYAIIYKNGAEADTTSANRDNPAAPASGGYAFAKTTSALLSLVATDYIEGVVYQDSGGDRSLSATLALVFQGKL